MAQKKTTTTNTKLHTIDWVAEQLGMSRRNVYRLFDSGELEKVNLGKRIARVTDVSWQAYFARITKAA